MLIESRTLLSIVSLIVLFTSFVASFKHQNGIIFIVGLVVALLVNRSDALAPSVREMFAVTSDSSYAAMTAKPEDRIKMTPTASPPPPDFQLDAPVDAVKLVSQNTSLLESQNQQRAVYGFGRPTISEVMSGQRSPGDLVPNFNTFAHVLVGNLRTTADPQIDVDRDAPQNPELLKLVPEGSTTLVAAKDYFPNCKNAGLAGRTRVQDPRDARRCFVRTGTY